MVWFLPMRLALYSVPLSLNVLQSAFLPDLGQMAAVQLVGPDDVLNWDGSNSNGQRMASGTYMMAVYITDSFGKTVTLSADFALIRSPVQTEVGIYNSAGELVRHFQVGTVAPQYLHLDADSVTPGNAVKIEWSSSGGQVLWDGLNDQGQELSSGVYTVRLTRSEPGKSPVVMSGTVTLLAAPNDLLNGALIAPQPLPVGATELKIFVPQVAPTGTVLVDFYSLAGERVGRAAGHGPAITWTLPRQLAGGTYLARIEVQSATGAQARTVLKFACIR